MIYTEMTKKAMKICFEAHKEQVDKSGIPYVFHPMIIAEHMTDELTTVTALLHDVVEDTDLTLEDLEALGFPKEVRDAIFLLTHADSEPYFDYVKRIKENPIARAVKLGDLAHNSTISRLNQITEKDLERLKKYEKAIQILSE